LAPRRGDSLVQRNNQDGDYGKFIGEPAASYISSTSDILFVFIYALYLARKQAGNTYGILSARGTSSGVRSRRGIPISFLLVASRQNLLTNLLH
jgi:hypothetical protein